MVVAVQTVAVQYLAPTADVEIQVPVPLRSTSYVYVYYGRASIEAVRDFDYTVRLAADFQTFYVTPKTSLIEKLNALTASDATEKDAITVRRSIPYETSATAASSRDTTFVSDEFDKIAMQFQQLQETLNRALTLAPGIVGSAPLLQLVDPTPNATLVVGEDGIIRPGPLATDIENAANSAVVATSAMLAVIARTPSYYETFADMIADTTVFPADTLLNVRETGCVYRVLLAGSSGDFERADTLPLEAVTVPVSSGPDVLGVGATAAALLGAPALTRFRDGVVTATDIGMKTGSTYADDCVTRLDAFMDAVRAGDVNTLIMGAGQYYFSNSVDLTNASNFALVGRGVGVSKLTLSSDTNAHKGKFCRVGGFVATYVYVASEGQTVFSGLDKAAALLAFTTSDTLTVLVDGEEVTFTSNATTDVVTLDAGAPLNAVVTIQVAAGTYGRMSISGFTLDCLSGTADQDAQFFNLGAIADLSLSKLQLSSRIGGFVRAGYEGIVARTVIEDIRGNIDPANGITVVDVAQCGRFEMRGVMLTGAESGGPKSGAMVRLKPISGAVCDTFRMQYCAMYAVAGVDNNVMVDMSDGSVTNIWLDNCTFDRGLKANLQIIDGTGATEARWCRNTFLQSNYFRLAREGFAVGANNIAIEISGANTRFDNFQVQGGIMGFQPQASVVVKRTNTGSQVNGFSLRGVAFVHQNEDAGAAAIPAVIDVGAPNVHVDGCSLSPGFQYSVPRVNRFVRTTSDDVASLHVTNNLDDAVLVETMSHFNYTSQKPAMIIENNSRDTKAWVAANFNSLAHAINKVNKYAGRRRYSSTLGAEVYATGALVGDTWKKVSDDTVAYTPV